MRGEQIIDFAVQSDQVIKDIEKLRVILDLENVAGNCWCGPVKRLDIRFDSYFAHLTRAARLVELVRKDFLKSRNMILDPEDHE